MSQTFSIKPAVVTHKCGASWDMYSYEMPPKVTLCTGCGEPLAFLGHDAETNAFVYRKLK